MIEANNHKVFEIRTLTTGTKLFKIWERRNKFWAYAGQFRAKARTRDADLWKAARETQICDGETA